MIIRETFTELSGFVKVFFSLSRGRFRRRDQGWRDDRERAGRGRRALHFPGALYEGISDPTNASDRDYHHEAAFYRK